MSIKYTTNSNSNHGLVIILGTKYGGDDSKSLVVEQALTKNKALNVMMVDFEDEIFNADKLTHNLSKFISENSKTTIIVGIHGAEVFYGSGHYSIVGPVVNDSFFSFLGHSAENFIHGIFNGKVIKSSRVLEAIGKAVSLNEDSEKELNVWQYSCQGSKLIDAAQYYLPKNTNYVSESKGFIMSGFFLNTMLQTLNSNQDFTFDELYKNYLAMSSKLSKNYGTGYTEPVKLVIGEKPETSVEKADKFLKEIKNKTINQEKLKPAIEKHCQKFSQATPNKLFTSLLTEYNDDYCQSNFEYYINNRKMNIDTQPSLSFSSCINQNNQLSFISQELYKILGLGQISASDCVLNYIGATLEDFYSLTEHYYS